ncbi:hypothetical protein [Neorhizobium galegae]|uniref:hypothetical protein n=1 Tax=Neorhizobium galegae TaxID=399 RepID=UPI00069A93E0|nr:hypothetical protein [Neorhizobium galegae]
MSADGLRDSAGLLDQVDAWISTQDRGTQVADEYSGTFVRNEPMMQAGFVAMGFTPQQVEAFSSRRRNYREPSSFEQALVLLKIQSLGYDQSRYSCSNHPRQKRRNHLDRIRTSRSPRVPLINHQLAPTHL